MSSPIQARTVGVSLGLLTTVGLGLVIRWALAGQLFVLTPFKHLRHAHSHLGVFGVLFPLAWIVWARAGVWTPTRRWRILYWLCTWLAVFGFLRAGYKVDAIIGSTGVLLVWLVSAWHNRSLLWEGTWLSSGPISIVLSALCIVPVPLNTRTHPEVAQAWVETFLTLLVLGVIVPSALSNGRSAPALAWVGAAAITALFFGAWPAWYTGLGAIAIGGMLLHYTLHQELPLDRKLGWLLVGIGMLAVGSHVLPVTHHVIVGSLHFLVLGPVLMSLGAQGFARWPALWVRLLALGLVGAMAGALILAGLAIPGPWMWVAAVAGSSLACGWGALAIAEGLTGLTAIRPLS